MNVEVNPDMSDDARAQGDVLIETFRRIRGRGREFMAMLTPVGCGRVGCAMAYWETAGERAGQTLAAAVAIRSHWHPTEVLWASDAYATTVQLRETGVDTSERLETLILGYSNSDLREVQYASLPYRMVNGEVEFLDGTVTWGGSMAEPMDAAIISVVYPDLTLPRVPTTEELAEMQILLTTGAEFN